MNHRPSHRLPKIHRLLLAFAAVFTWLSPPSFAAPFAWQDSKAEVRPHGDLAWRPETFAYRKQGETRYIDFEQGDDQNDGTSRDRPWKHHPWDFRASGKAAAAQGSVTYVFKRGVTYRIYSEEGQAFLRADESGRPEAPIRLTSDPDWGQGEAIIAGSRAIEDPWKRAKATDAPARMDTETQTIWFIDLPLPDDPQQKGSARMSELTLYQIGKDGEIRNLLLASDVGWPLTNPNFALQHWNTWDEYRRANEKKGQAYYDEQLKGHDPDFFDGGSIWSQYAWVIANPTPDLDPIQPGSYDPVAGTIAYKDGSDPVNPGTRYLIENLPQFLDQPGEFYYARKFSDAGGRLFLRAHDDADPNQVRVELATAYDSILIENQSHIEISGLVFRFNGRRPFPLHSEVISIEGNCSHLAIRHCRFEHTGNDAIFARLDKGQTIDHLTIADCDFNWINGGSAIDIQGDGGGRLAEGEQLGVLNHVQILRNRTRNTGLYRHGDHRWSNVPAISCNYVRVAEVAGNMVDMAWGSGIVVQGGKSGKDHVGWDIPLIRILVHHNKIENVALAVNDYGGLSLWQHGPMYAFSNVVGNSVGHWPGGFFNNGTINLSYPIYLDGGFKIFNFNSITWARPLDPSDPTTSNASAFFNVFGFLNPFVNNTVYGSGIGLGGTSGNRNDYLGNLFVDIGREFIDVNHGGNPSLIGGDDTGESGIDGAETLAYGYNLFHGPAKAGVVATVKQGAKKDLQAEKLDTLRRQMQAYPLRFAQLGRQAQAMPIVEAIPSRDPKPSASHANFMPAAHSPAIDYGVDYFLPWGLAATVGEWHFNANHANPSLILDYHYYPTRAYFNRSMYYRVPVFELTASQATLDDYVDSEQETWTRGALAFDGRRYASLPHEKMASDVIFDLAELNLKIKRPPLAPWQSDGSRIRFPGSARKTPDIGQSNLIVETVFRADPGAAASTLVSKRDPQRGYSLSILSSGHARFEIQSGAAPIHVDSQQKVNTNAWHHLLAELDRQAGQLRIYLDGELSSSAAIRLDPTSSLSNGGDLVVGANQDRERRFRGAIDFLRIAQSTLAESETSIEELYAWQTRGPIRYDFAGLPPKGARDSGAIEYRPGLSSSQ